MDEPYWKVDVLVFNQEDHTSTYVPCYPAKDRLLSLVEDVCGQGKKVILTVTVLGDDWSEVKDPWEKLHSEPAKIEI